MNLVFFGTGDFAVPALRALAASSHHNVIAAVSQPDRPSGRGRRITPTPLHAAADELNVPHLQTDNVNALPTDDVLRGADLIMVAAFGQKIGPALLAAPQHGCFNIHASLLPRHRGAAPFQWALLSGDERTGVTIFKLDAKWDNGPIVLQRETPIRDDETADELHDRLATLGAESVIDAVDAIERNDPMHAQDPSQATRAPKLAKSDGWIDWSADARRIVRRIHGLWSWPAAACDYVSQDGRRERVLLARAKVSEAPITPSDAATPNPTFTGEPGAFRHDGAVQTGDGAVQLLEVKPAGGKCMPFDAFRNGRRVQAGDRLERPAE